jgi:hypothetical protein
MTVIYALSGIALNHLGDWNPSYMVTQEEVSWQREFTDEPLPEEAVLEFLDRHGERDGYKKHYRPSPDRLKIFIHGGSVVIDLTTGEGKIEKLSRRPVFYEVNFLHYNPRRLWTWFSDIFSAALIIIAITGLFVLKGKHGITRRGAWLTGLGVIIPLVFLIVYL